MSGRRVGNMTDDLRQALAMASERALGYREQFPPPAPGADLDALRRALDAGLPERGRGAAEVIDHLVKAVEPGLIGISSPDFYGWVMGASHPVGVAAEWLTASWGQNAGIYETSPAAAVAEEVAGRWLLDLLRLPGDCSVGFVTGATMASFVGLAAARSEVLLRAGWDCARDGLFGAPPVTVYLGAQAHASVLAALRYLGFGERQLIAVDSDEQGGMRPASLAQALRRTDGPAIVVGQAGHIHSGGFDPFEQTIPLARERGAWVHVDGAFGLWARAAPALSALASGVELADSWAVDGHKWLQIPYDSGFAIVRDGAAMQRAMAISASYLGTGPRDARNPSNYVPELSRRARGFAVWAVLQALGRHGVREMVERHCRCARELGQRLLQEPGIRVLNRIELNQLALTFGPTGASQAERDACTRQVIAALQRENRCFVSGASWSGHWIMRVSVISHYTDTPQMEALAAAIIRAWRCARPRQQAPGSGPGSRGP